MMPSCLKSSPIRTATETREGSVPRRPAEIRSTARSEGTTTTGVFVNLQDSVKGGSGGGGGGGCWQLAANIVRGATNAAAANTFEIVMCSPVSDELNSYGQRSNCQPAVERSPVVTLYRLRRQRSRFRCPRGRRR